MTKRSKILIGVGLLVVAMGGGGFAVATRDRGATQVRIEAIGRKDLVASVRSSGWVRPKRSVQIQADIMGRIIELKVKEGDAVRRGDLLLRIDPTQYEAAVVRAEAAVSEALSREAQARATLLQARQNLDRARGMLKVDSLLISRQSLEDAETQVKVQTALLEAARHGVDMTRAALREAQDHLSKTVIRSPIDGLVTRLNVEEGEMAIIGTMNNPGSLLLTISDLAAMEAVVQVDETDVPQIRLGDSAVVEIDAFPHEKFTGRVTEIGHSATRSREQTAGMSLGSGGQGQAVDFEVVIRLDNPPATLRPDLSATAEVVTDTRKNALVVPIIALTVREKEQPKAVAQESREARSAQASLATAPKDEEGVYIVKQGKAHFVAVKVGIAGEEHFEVVSGLSQGDSVVAGPYETIRTLENDKPVRQMQTGGDDAKKKSS